VLNVEIISETTASYARRLAGVAHIIHGGDIGNQT
jgi:hypothetical protein